MAQHEIGHCSESSRNLQFRWNKLSASSTYIRRQGWEFRDLPGELRSLPESVSIPEKLRQILDWSLIGGSNWSFPPVPKAQDKSTPQSNQSEVLEGETSTGVLKASTSQTDLPRRKTDSGSTLWHEASSSHISVNHHSHSVDSDRSLRITLLSKLRSKRSDGHTSGSEAKAGWRSATASATASATTVECTSCFEELPEAEMSRLKSCRHWYCKECLATLIMTAMAAEASFPPKCCLSPIPLKQILKALDAKQRENYQSKAAEYAVPSTERWYCPDRDCLKWIPRSKLKINRIHGYDCPHCAAKLCRTCHGPAHPENTECPEDFGLEATLETAEVEGWQRCYKCRTMVEHNTGCRHMTCRCRAEFCYVCGLRWQTCSCTETDAADKRAGIQQRRSERAARIAAAEALENDEAAEIARAIAEVEEMEIREAEERRLEEERLQKEEDDLLLQLEAERKLEEAKRREEAEQAERDFQAALLSSFEDDLRQLQSILNGINDHQLKQIELRHSCEDASLSTIHLADEEEAKQSFETHTATLSRNIQQRQKRLQTKHKADIEALGARQEEDEDDLFLQVQMRLRGKANKESRMERMLAEIHKQHEEEKKELEEKQKEEAAELEKHFALDQKGITQLYQCNMQKAKDKQTAAIQIFGHNVGADRQYFEIVVARRIAMISLHGEKSLESMRSSEEPVGLTEYEASQIQPSLPDIYQGEPGPSSTSRPPPAPIISHTPPPLAPSPRTRYYQNNPDKHPQHGRIPTLRLETSVLNGTWQPAVQRQPSTPPIPGAFPTESLPSHSLSPPHPQTQAPPSPTPQTQAYKIPSTDPPPLEIATPSSLPEASRNLPPTSSRTDNAGTEIIVFEAISMAALTAGQTLMSQHPGLSNGKQPAVFSRKSNWEFMKPKDLTDDDELKRRMGTTVGDAF